MQIENYPFVQELVTDTSGRVCKVVLELKDYQRLMKAIEDEGLYRAMQVARNETPLSREQALQELE